MHKVISTLVLSCLIIFLIIACNSPITSNNPEILEELTLEKHLEGEAGKSIVYHYDLILVNPNTPQKYLREVYGKVKIIWDGKTVRYLLNAYNFPPSRECTLIVGDWSTSQSKINTSYTNSGGNLHMMGVINSPTGGLHLIYGATRVLFTGLKPIF